MTEASQVLMLAEKNLVIRTFTIYKGSTLFVLTILFTTDVTTKSFYKLCMLIQHMTYTYMIYACCISKNVAVRLKEAFVLSSRSALARLHLEY